MKRWLFIWIALLFLGLRSGDSDRRDVSADMSVRDFKLSADRLLNQVVELDSLCTDFSELR